MSTENRNSREQTQRGTPFGHGSTPNIPTMQFTQPVPQEEFDAEAPPAEVEEPAFDDESVKRELTQRGFTPGQINLSLEILRDPTLLSAKIERVDQDVLNYVVPQLDPSDVARALDIIGYPTNVRMVARAFPSPEYTSEVLASATSKRVAAILASIVPAASSAPTSRRFRITIDGRNRGVVSANSVQDALRTVDPSNARSAVVEEI